MIALAPDFLPTTKTLTPPAHRLLTRSHAHTTGENNPLTCLFGFCTIPTVSLGLVSQIGRRKRVTLGARPMVKEEAFAVPP